MSYDMIQFDGETYPAFQSRGFASQFAIPYAKHYCNGMGVDIGCNRLEWMFPGAIPVDPNINQHTATNYPYKNLDYVFSSHCLEHLEKWVDALDYWHDSLRPDGVLFLYLPDFSQRYWRPWNNRKHLHSFTPQIIKEYFETKYYDINVSGIDLNNSFMIVGKRICN
ncbi:methyltransferase domain containing protein [Microcystis phage Mel-JY01]